MPNIHETRSMRGFSLLEVVIAATILLVMIMAVTTLMISGQDAAKYAERMNRATEITQDLADDMRNEVRSAVRLFGNDVTGLAYKARLESWALAPTLASTLPTIATTDTFKKDVAGNAKTGNELVFAKHAWSAEYTTPTNSRSLRYDVFRIVHYYLKAEDGGPQPGRSTGLNLVRWVSEPLVDANAIDAITDPTDHQELLVHLLSGSPDAQGVSHPRLEVVWKLGEDPATVGTLRQIVAGGALSDVPGLPRPPAWTILVDPAKSSNGLLFIRHHSLATNFSQSSYGIGRFAIPNSAGDGFPHGMEVQIIGPAAARQVLVRLAVVSTNRHGHTAFASQQMVVDARDL